MVNSSIFSSDQVRLFLKRLGIFVLILFFFDQSIGFALKTLYFKTREGDFGGRINRAIEAEADLYIIGNSRAQAHYVSRLLSDSLHCSVFNAGMNGQNILYYYGILQLLVSAHPPKIILLDANAIDLFDPSNEGFEKLSKLLPFHGNDSVKPLLKMRSEFEDIKLLSAIYPFNSMVHSIIKFSIYPEAEGSKANNGYVPLSGSRLDSSGLTPGVASLGLANPDDSLSISPVRRLYLDRFFALCRLNNITVISVASPVWKPVPSCNDSLYFYTYHDMLKKWNIPHIAFSEDTMPEITDPNLYRDELHLNHKGATRFTLRLIDKLRPILNQSNNP